jgi:Arc/MetJ family transcription regulator
MCKKGGCTLPTNLAINDQLLEEALRIGGQRTKKATVNEALREYVQRRKRLGALEAFGTIAMDPAYDYKKLRRRR